jgi:hypothetical protein
MIDSITVSDFGRRNNRPTLVTAFWLCLFIVVTITAITLRLSNRVVASRSPDEEVYIHYATRVAGSGIEGGRALVQEYNREASLWIYPSPIRVGYIYLVAAVMKLSGATADQAAVSISSVFSIGAFVLAALLGLRFFDRWSVLVGLALLSVSPIELAIARRAWQDSVWGCIGLLLFYLCLEASVSMRPKTWRICFWAVGVYYLTIKGSALVVYGLCTLWLVGSAWLQEGSLRKCFYMVIVSALIGATSFAALAWCSGGAFSVMETIQHSTLGRGWNQYGHQFQNGPWYWFFLGFLELSPITILLCVAGIAMMILPKGTGVVGHDPGMRQRHAAWAIIYLIFTLLTAATAPADLKNLRYVTILVGPCCLLSGLAVVYLLAFAKVKLPLWGYHFAGCAVALGLSLTCLTDYRRFERIFVRNGLNDLAIVRVIDSARAVDNQSR